jgi:hypothetical protein
MKIRPAAVPTILTMLILSDGMTMGAIRQQRHDGEMRESQCALAAQNPHRTWHDFQLNRARIQNLSSDTNNDGAASESYSMCGDRNKMLGWQHTANSKISTGVAITSK